MFEPLAVRSADEPGTIYGLLAEEMLVAPDKSSITFRIHPEGALLQRRPGDGRRRQVLVRHADQQGRGARGARRVRRHQERRRSWTTARSASTSKEPHRRHDLHDRQPAGVLAQVGRGTGRQAEAVRPGRQRVSRSRPGPYTIASTDSGRGIEFKRNPDYWARDLGVGRGQFNFDRVVYRLYRDRAVEHGGVQGRRVRPDPGVRRVAVRARPRGRQVAATAASSRRCSSTAWGRGIQAYLLNLRRPHVPGPPRARGARLHVRLREDQPVRHARACLQPLLELRLRGEGHCRARASSRSSSRSATSCRPRCSARRTCRRGRTPAPTRCATT